MYCNIESCKFVFQVLQRRSFVLPQALGGGHIRNEASPDDIDDESEQEGADGSKPKPFCRNPAEIRAEAERKRAEKAYRSDRAADKKKGGRPAGVKDVVGNAKGQGQDKQVLINRARKNANKNKHQRAMADKKMSKGMF